MEERGRGERRREEERRRQVEEERGGVLNWEWTHNVQIPTGCFMCPIFKRRIKKKYTIPT